jgi:hypothetical protein
VKARKLYKKYGCHTKEKKNESQESLQNIKPTQNELYLLTNKTN